MDQDVPVGQLYVGCAGYNYPHWRKGVFYPKGLQQDRELKFYAQVFSTCEVNTTFYGTPSAETIKTWKEQVKVNPTFRFALKMRKTITHENPLNIEALERDLPLFWERAEQLKEGGTSHLCGPILFQFPPTFTLSIEALERLVRYLPRDYLYAIEFRHASWLVPEVWEFMRDQGWGLVQHALPDIKLAEVDQVTSDFVYLRLHGKKVEHAWDYMDKELEPYVQKVIGYRRQGLDCYVYFLNDADGHAPKNAFDFWTMVCRAMNENLPTRPDDNKISNYFGRVTGGAAEGGGGAGGVGRKREAESKDKEQKEEEKEKEGEGKGLTIPSFSASKRPKIEVDGDRSGKGGVGTAAATSPSSSPSRISRTTTPSTKTSGTSSTSTPSAAANKTTSKGKTPSSSSSTSRGAAAAAVSNTPAITNFFKPKEPKEDSL